ncbi:MAG: hypothetical protein Q9190_002903, partial [Brigantiaea leucoxantha]
RPFPAGAGRLGATLPNHPGKPPGPQRVGAAAADRQHDFASRTRQRRRRQRLHPARHDPTRSGTGRGRPDRRLRPRPAPRAHAAFFLGPGRECRRGASRLGDRPRPHPAQHRRAAGGRLAGGQASLDILGDRPDLHYTALTSAGTRPRKQEDVMTTAARRLARAILLAAPFLAAAPAFAAAPSPVGTWRTFDDSDGKESGAVTIFDNGGTLYGNVSGQVEGWGDCLTCFAKCGTFICFCGIACTSPYVPQPATCYVSVESLNGASERERRGEKG